MNQLSEAQLLQCLFINITTTTAIAVAIIATLPISIKWLLQLLLDSKT